jgi:hypothetical protein
LNGPKNNKKNVIGKFQKGVHRAISVSKVLEKIPTLHATISEGKDET